MNKQKHSNAAPQKRIRFANTELRRSICRYD